MVGFYPLQGDFMRRLGMVWRIARKECLELFRDGRLVCVGALMAVLIVAAVVTNDQHARADTTARAAARERQQQLWLNQPDQNPHGAAHDGLFAIKPVRPLAAVDRGIETFTGTVIPMQAHSAQHAAYRPAADRTSLVRFGELTAAMLLQLLAPLLIIVAGFDMVARERERGTLHQLLAAGVSLPALLLGKALALGAVVGLVALLAALIGLGVIVLGDQVTFVDTALRAALLVGAYGLYLTGFVAATLAVSSVAKTSRAALGFLLVYWMLGVVVVPRAAADAAAWLAPAPTIGEFSTAVDADLRNGLDGHNPYGEREEAFRRQVLADYGVESVEQLPVNFDALLLQADEEYAAVVYERRMREVWNAHERQAFLHLAVFPVAPIVAVRTVSMTTAGTDLAQHRHFADAAEAYRQAFVGALNHDMATRSRSGDWNYRANRDLWASIAPFTYVAPSWRDSAARARGAWMALAGWCVFVIAAGALAVRRQIVV